MLKRLFTIILILSSSLFVYRPLHAIDLYAFGSYTQIEDADGTWGGGLGIAIPLFTDYVRFDTRLFFLDKANFDRDDELQLIPLDFGLQIHILPHEEINPYILGGLSWVYAEADRANVDSDFGGYIGAGVDFGLNETFKIFGELSYRMVEITNKIGRYNEDIDISGVTANLGIKFTF
jgi:hypothetical protein